MVTGLSGWSFLGAVMAAFLGFGAYMYWGPDTRSANQLDVGKYVVPELEAAQPKQQSGGPPQSTKNSSSGSEAPNQTLSSEDPPTILNDSEPAEPTTGPGVLTETPSSRDTVMFSKTSAQPLPDQAAGVDMPAASCTSQIWCADPLRPMSSQDNVTTQDASPCIGDNGDISCAKDKAKEKARQKTKEKPLGHHAREKRSR
jgi:hypothetical protein